MRNVANVTNGMEDGASCAEEGNEAGETCSGGDTGEKEGGGQSMKSVGEAAGALKGAAWDSAAAAAAAAAHCDATAAKSITTGGRAMVCGCGCGTASGDSRLPRARARRATARHPAGPTPSPRRRSPPRDVALPHALRALVAATTGAGGAGSASTVASSMAAARRCTRRHEAGPTPTEKREAVLQDVEALPAALRQPRSAG